MKYEIKEAEKFKFIETEGGEETLLLLHGLFGALSNFGGILEHFGAKYNVVIPILPIYELPLRKVSVKGYVEYIREFVEYKGYGKVHALGNSLGGHIGLLFTLQCPDKLKSLILTGSSGLFESAMGSSYPKRGNYEYIRQKTADTFYDPKMASKELVDEVFDIVNDRSKLIRILATAKSAIRHNLGEELHNIKVPTLLIWGKQDKVTPPFVGEKFHELIPNSELVFVDKCGHAPMMERPGEFNKHLEAFLQKVE